MSDGLVDTWLWDFGDGSTSTEQNPEHIFTDEDYFDVSLTVTGPGGTETMTKEDFINTLNLVSVTVSASPEEICLGEESMLDADAEGGSESYTYSWTSDPEGFVSDQESPMVSPEETTTYMVEVSDGEQVVNGEVVVTVNPLPEITLGDWPEQLCNQQEPPVQLTAIPEGGTYTGDNVSEEGLFTPEGADVGWHVITYTYEDENGCENMAYDSIYVDNCVGIFDVFDNESLSLYPNPNTGQFTIKSNQNIQSVILINQLGSVVYHEEFISNQIRLNTSLKEGVYFVKIKLIDKDGIEKLLYKKILIN
jgi:PKD repeat protein